MSGAVGIPMGARGFTLIELLVALLLATFLIVSAGSLTLNAMRTSLRNETYALASTLAEDVLECVKLQIRSGTPVGDCNPGRTNPTVVPLHMNVGAPVVELNPTGYLPGVVRLEVTVSWTNPVPGSITVESLELRRG